MTPTRPQPAATRRRFAASCLYGALLIATPALAADAPSPGRGTTLSLFDARGDAVIRRTDTGGLPVDYSGTLPDVTRLSLRAWSPFVPTGNPYDGTPSTDASSGLFRLDLTFSGLVNPPGTLGLGGRPFDPFRFGPNPVYGFLELDIDQNRDTGGELGDAAEPTFLANVGRFGVQPILLEDRAAVWGDQVDNTFESPPQIERSGAEFVLSLCGCIDVTLLAGDDDNDGEFGPGETWLLSGRFFRRAGGFASVSNAFNGSAPGEYDPVVTLRFRHDPNAANNGGETTITLVYALNMSGAAALTGQPVQAPNLDVSDQTSVEEAMLDIVNSLMFNPVPGPAGVLANGWSNADVSAALDPVLWRPTAIFAAPYPVQGALYLYTDVGFGLAAGDINGDGGLTGADLARWDAGFAANEGGPRDLDDAPNSISIAGWPRNFSLFDLNADGAVDDQDRQLLVALTAPPSDINADGVVNSTDLAILLGNWGTFGEGDVNADGIVNAIDLATLLGDWGPNSQ